MNESEYMKLREAIWRRELTAEEETRLRSYFLVHPEAQLDYEEEKAVTALLVKLPDQGLSSNFTAQLLQRLDLETRETERAVPVIRWRGLSWLPRFALASLVIGVSGVGYQRIHDGVLRERANSVLVVTKVAANLPDVQMWQDFEAISKLNQLTPSSRDDILWAALSAPSEN